MLVRNDPVCHTKKGKITYICIYIYIYGKVFFTRKSYVYYLHLNYLMKTFVLS